MAGAFLLPGKEEPLASRIRHIIIEIGGDTTKLEQSLKSVNSTIKSTQSQLKDVTKLLKLDLKKMQNYYQMQRLLKNAKTGDVLQGKVGR